MDTKDNIASMTKQSLVFVPKDMMTKPFFPAREINRPISFQIGNKIYTIGYTDKTLWKFAQSKSLSISHAKLFFILLKQFLCAKDFCTKKTNTTINVSVYELAQVFFQYKKPSQKHYNEICSLLGDLQSIAIKVENGSIEQIFTVLKYDTIAKKNKKNSTVLSNIELSKQFLEYFFPAEKINIKLDVLLSLKSKIASAVYLYIPSRAYHHTGENPFKISITNLLTQIGYECEKLSKNRKLRYFVRREGKYQYNVFEDLDGIEVLSGTLRVRLSDTPLDYIAEFWIERNINYSKTFFKALLKEYNVPTQLQKKYFSNLSDRNFYAEEKVNSIEPNLYERNKRFYDICQNILGREHFNGIVGQLCVEISACSNINDPQAVLGTRLKEEIVKTLKINNKYYEN